MVLAIPRIYNGLKCQYHIVRISVRSETIITNKNQYSYILANIIWKREST